MDNMDYEKKLIKKRTFKHSTSCPISRKETNPKKS